MVRKYVHEDVAAVPHGWQVRTVRQGAHRVRVAFPPGPRHSGSGRLISILHPRRENNPCNMRYLVNPAELLIMGNPSRRTRPNPSTLGKMISRMKDRGASSREVGRALSHATNPHAWETRPHLGTSGKPGSRRRARDLQTLKEAQEFLRSRGYSWDRITRMSDGTLFETARREHLRTNPRRELSVPEKHQVRIAKDTLRMSDPMVGVMGGMTKEQAREILRKHGIRFKENPFISRQHAIEMTVHDVGSTGKVGEQALRAYVEGRISRETWNKAVRKGREIFERGGMLLPQSNPRRSTKWEDLVRQQFRWEVIAQDPAHEYVLGTFHVMAPATATETKRWLKAVSAVAADIGRKLILRPSPGEGQLMVLQRKNPRSARGLLMQAFRTRVEAEDAAARYYEKGYLVQIAERRKTGRHYSAADEAELSARPWGVYKIASHNPLLESAVGGAAAGTMAGITGGLIASGAVKRALRGNPGGLSVRKPRKGTTAAQKFDHYTREIGRLRLLEQALRGEGKTVQANYAGVLAEKATALAQARRNPAGEAEAANLYREFHGKDPREILELQEPEARGVTLTNLGALVELQIVPVEGSDWVRLDFAGSDVKVASNPKGTQIYFVGGDQRLDFGDLDLFGTDQSKELIELGEAAVIVYRAKKSITDFKAANWKHDFGEESGLRPIVVYDKRTSRMMLVGGEYEIEAPGIIN